MQEKRFTITSNYDEWQIQAFLYAPDEQPKGIVQLVHGMCEYKERYADFMKYLCEQGYVVACHDHRGHGDSAESLEQLGYLGDRSGEALVTDALQVTEYLKTEYPDLPVVLFGHSMGSMVVRCMIREYDDLFQKLIVCGSPSKNPMVGAAIVLAQIQRVFMGAHHRSKLLTYLSTGKGDERFKGEGKCAWLSKNRANVEVYLQDPKCRYKFTANGFENLFRLMKRTYVKKGHALKNPQMLVHFVAGQDDPVIVNEKQWLAAQEFLRKVGYQKVSGKLYAGMRHEILKEDDREIVYADLLAFIEK